MTTTTPTIKNTSAVIIQIATPDCIGTGFLWAAAELIVTNLHIVEGHPKVVVHGAAQVRTLVKVIYTDAVYDIAFLKMPVDFPKPSLAFCPSVSEGEEVFIQEDGIVSGKITDSAAVFHGLSYLKVDFSLDTAYSGSPIFNHKSEVIGINSGVQSGKTQAYVLPIHYLLATFEAYKNSNSEVATRCFSCQKITTPAEDSDQCSHCEAIVDFPFDYPKYEAEGVSHTIETLIKKIGHQPELTRRGLCNWALIEGSATIYLSYYEPRGYILGDAVLCQLPKNQAQIEVIYEFLLRQNYLIKGLTFSIYHQNIVLSLIIYDRHLNTDTAVELLQTLMEKADYYDNILVEKYGAIWRTQTNILLK